MASLVLPRRFSHQPQGGAAALNLSNDLTRNFIAGWLPTDSMYFGPGPAPQRTMVADPTWVGDSRYGLGVGRVAFGSGVAQAGMSILIGRTSDCTLMSISRPGDQNGQVATCGQSSSGVSLSIRQGTSTEDTYSGTIYISSNRSIGGTYPIPRDGSVTVTAIRQKYGTTAGTAEQALFVNGKKDPLVGNYTGQMIATGNFGCYSFTRRTVLFGLFLWNRALSDSEIVSMWEDPYQIFQDNRRFFFPTSADTPTLQRAGIGIVNGQMFVLNPGAGYAPLVLLNGRVKIRSGSEGIPLTLDNGRLRTLAPGETLRP